MNEFALLGFHFVGFHFPASLVMQDERLERADMASFTKKR
jgi:hypothetical protein